MSKEDKIVSEIKWILFTEAPIRRVLVSKSIHEYINTLLEMDKYKTKIEPSPSLADHEVKIVFDLNVDI